MSPTASPIAPVRPLGFVPIGIFFFFGALMASYAAFTPLNPGTFLDRGWALNPTAHVQLSSMGRIMGAPFILLAFALLLGGIGWFRRRFWGWILGVVIITINLAGDLVHMFMGEWLKSAVGVTIAALLLFYLTRPGMRNYFVRGNRSV
jgi:hypothetical protein